MVRVTTSALLQTAAAAACTIPTAPLSANITQGFAVQVQNPAFPEVHNRLMNLWSAGGGDQHLYLAPAGDRASDLTLIDGVLTKATVSPVIRAVINGEVSEPETRGCGADRADKQ